MPRNYIINPSARIRYKGKQVLNTQEILDAINFANDAMKSLNEHTKQFDINIFETLGMRNLSGLVGEYFVRSVMRVSNGKLNFEFKWNDNMQKPCVMDFYVNGSTAPMGRFNYLYKE